MNIKPTEDSANKAAGNDHLEMVKYLYEEFKIKPTEDSANKAAGNDHVDMVDYLISLSLSINKKI